MDINSIENFSNSYATRIFEEVTITIFVVFFVLILLLYFASLALELFKNL